MRVLFHSFVVAVLVGGGTRSDCSPTLAQK